MNFLISRVPWDTGDEIELHRYRAGAAGLLDDAPLETAVVTADASVTFTQLDNNNDYVAVKRGDPRHISFHTPSLGDRFTNY